MRATVLGFSSWINSDNRDPYNSFGNGSAMRVSPCAWVMDCGFVPGAGPGLLEDLLHDFLLGRLITIREGIKGELWQRRMLSLCVAINFGLLWGL